MYTLEQKHALVCGSSQGIGRACAMELARFGAQVTLLARNAEALETVRCDLPTEHGQSHDVLVADFTDWQAVQRVVQQRLDGGQVYHILVNNTGGPHSGPILDATPDDFLAAVRQHVICNHVLAQLLVPGMKAASYGRIINIISTSVIQPIKGLGVSNTTRGAVANWARSLTAEVAEDGITVNNVLPGYTDTARLTELFDTMSGGDPQLMHQIRQAAYSKIPAGRFAEASEIGAVVAFLATGAASYVNGANIPVDGGKLARQ
jgi:3-oxoacyl-[acyl-carrier protein] reductase